MSAITTHVLDLTAGRPAAGVVVILSARASDGRFSELVRGVTDADGRVRDLLAADHALEAGIYSLRFESAAYFAARGVETFYPDVVVSFRVDAASGHHHVPLLLSPFGYTTYRGS